MADGLGRVEEPSVPSDCAGKAVESQQGVDVRIAELLTGLSQQGGSLMSQLSIQSADGRLSAYPVIEAKTSAATPVLVTGPNQLIQVAIPGIPEQMNGRSNAASQENASSGSPASGDGRANESWRSNRGQGEDVGMDGDQEGEDSRTFLAGGPRPKRYRNQKQKLSNSMAQKRYRERKKRAFMDMRQVIDNLTAEVDSLRNVKNENERLRQTTGALQDLIKSQQDQIETLRGRVKPEPIAEASPGGREDTTAGVQGMEVMMISRPPASETTVVHSVGNNTHCLGESAASRTALGLDAADGVNGRKCSDGSTTQQHCGSLTVPTCIPSVAPQNPDATISNLQNEWNTHMLAMEQVLAANRMQGLPNGPISEEALQLLSHMVSNLYSLNARLMSARVGQILEANRQNTARICRIFNGLAGRKPE